MAEGLRGSLQCRSPSLQFLGEFDQLGFGFLITGITGEAPGVGLPWYADRQESRQAL